MEMSDSSQYVDVDHAILVQCLADADGVPMHGLYRPLLTSSHVVCLYL